MLLAAVLLAAVALLMASPPSMLHVPLGMALAWRQAWHGWGPPLSAAEGRGPRRGTDPAGRPAVERWLVPGRGLLRLTPAPSPEGFRGAGGQAAGVAAWGG